MAQVCNVCRHHMRRAIEAKLAAGETADNVGALFEVDRDDIEYHKKHSRQVTVYAPISADWLLYNLMDIVAKCDMLLDPPGGECTLGVREQSLLMGQKGGAIDRIIKLTGAGFQRNPADGVPYFTQIMGAINKVLKNHPKLLAALDDELRVIEQESR